MSISKRLKHRNTAVVAGLAAAVALAGGVGVAAASGPSGTQDTPKVNSQAEEAEGTEEQEPALNGSVQVAEEEVAGESEQQESARLSSQATTTQQDAEQAALDAVPGGTVSGSELGNENGSLIWEVEVTKADGSQVEVKVDAGNGKVLAQEAEDEDEAGDDDEDEDETEDSDEEDEATTG